MVVSLLFSLHNFLRDYLIEKFYICQLPRLALYEMLRSMSEIELIKLALTSSKMDLLIKSARLKVRSYDIRFEGQTSNIDFGKDISAVFCGSKEFQRNERLSKYQLKKWSDTESEYETLIEIHKKLKNLFSPKHEELSLNMDELGGIDIEKHEYLTKLLETCISLCIYNGRISSKDLNFILEKARSDQYLQLVSVEIPKDFDSKFAFKFRSVMYRDARWLKMKHLYSIRNMNIVVLGKNNLNTSDLNCLIKHWINCEENTWEQLSIDVNNDPSIEELFDGVTVLVSNYMDTTLCYVLSKHTEKQNVILCVGFFDEFIRMTSVSIDNEFSIYENGPEKTSYQSELDILNILVKKEALKNELTIGEEEQEELQKLDMQLEEHQVRFIDGIANIH